ncbi:hypothetical protein [Flagellimonas crocea]|uniref:hypothetical protein n=1 Tax=Flagellimonas crocea TaxID=3067311 RepID=UPI00296F4CDA|nr:hypothetical protein [Muricauda sp. DH64]
MKKIDSSNMEKLHGGGLSKCEIGVIGGCFISGAAFTMALGPVGALWGVACSLTAAASDTCEGK